MILEVSYVAIYAVIGGILLWSASQLQVFLATTPVIADEACLARFKAVARRDMHLALLSIGLMTLGSFLGIAVIVRHGIRGGIGVVLMNVLFYAGARHHKAKETRARSLEASSPQLAEAHRRVSATWVKKALPDF